MTVEKSKIDSEGHRSGKSCAVTVGLNALYEIKLHKKHFEDMTTVTPHMRKIGMTRVPHGDFDHQKFAKDDPFCDMFYIK